MNKVHAFLKGSGATDEGITRQQAWDMSPGEFEACHTLIQWMFPTMTPSRAQPQSPVLSWEDVVAIRGDKTARQCIRENRIAYTKFLFSDYGKPLWLRRSDHNHLRITRAIESTSLLISPEYAQEFSRLPIEANAEAGYPVNIHTVTEFWNQARFYGRRMDAAHVKS